MTWIVDDPEWKKEPQDVSLRTGSWQEYVEIDRDGELHIHAGVDGNCCDTNLYIPMEKVVEFFKAVGWTLTPTKR